RVAAVLAARERAARRDVPRDSDEMAEQRGHQREPVGRIAAVAVLAVAAVRGDAEPELRAHAARGDDADRRQHLAPRALDDDVARALAVARGRRAGRWIGVADVR